MNTANYSCPACGTHNHESAFLYLYLPSTTRRTQQAPCKLQDPSIDTFEGKCEVTSRFRVVFLTSSIVIPHPTLTSPIRRNVPASKTHVMLV